MNILYVVSRPLEINTSASVRNRATINGLIELGHTVTVMTSSPDVNHDAYDSSLSVLGAKTVYVELGGAQTFAKSVRQNKALNKLRVILYNIWNYFNVYDNLKSFSSHINEIPEKLSEYDIIISSSDPKSSHLFVYNLIKNKGEEFRGRWIQVWGDPFAVDISAKSGNYAKRAKEEKRLISKADKVIYVSEITLNDQKQRYPAYSNKMYYAPIPFLTKRIYDNKISNKNTYTLSYCGDYDSSIRNILPLYKSVLELDDIRLTICGRSDVSLDESNRITILPRQSMKEVEKIEENSDILVHLSNLKGGQIPGKIYQYSGTNKPILFILDGDIELMKETFGKYDRFCFAENNPKSIREQIEKIIREKNIEYNPIESFAPNKIAKRIIE